MRENVTAEIARLRRLLSLAIANIPQEVWRDIDDALKTEWMEATSD